MTGIPLTMPSLEKSSLPMVPSLRRVFIGGFVFFLLFALAGCTRKPDQPVEVKRFVELTRRDFHALDNRLSPLLEQEDRSRKVDEALERFLSDADARAGRPNLGIAVLDGSMKYIAGRAISVQQQDAAPIQTSLSDFSYLEDLFKAADVKIAHESLYYKGREIFTVCSAIRSGKSPEAYICLFYDAETFRGVFGFGKPVFAEIDFSR